MQMRFYLLITIPYEILNWLIPIVLSDNSTTLSC